MRKRNRRDDAPDSHSAHLSKSEELYVYLQVTAENSAPLRLNYYIIRLRIFSHDLTRVLVQRRVNIIAKNKQRLHVTKRNEKEVQPENMCHECLKCLLKNGEKLWFCIIAAWRRHCDRLRFI